MLPGTREELACESGDAAGQGRTMKLCRIVQVAALVLAVGWSTPAPALDTDQPPVGAEFYKSLGPLVQTRLRFATDVSVAPGKPAFHVKVYDWVIGSRREALNFPFEGVAILELRSGKVETTINGVTVVRRAPEVWVVPQGSKVSIKTTSEVASLHGLVLITAGGAR